MQDDRSTNCINKNETFPLMAYQRTKNSLKRQWTCPTDDAIAAYVDRGLGEETKRRLESHLAKCERCRLMVADVVKLQRDIELPRPPLTAANMALSFQPRPVIGSRWIWASAAAMALLVLVGVIVIWRREPQKRALMAPAVSSAPMVAKVEPVTPDKAPPREITREPVIPSIVPVIISPSQDSTVERDLLEFTWKPLSRTRDYEITVATSDGDLLWSGRSANSRLRLPSTVVLERGSYFVWVTAYLTDGQIAKSSPVRFVIDR